MADVKVRAKYRGQKPDRTWAEEGEVFEIDAKLFSKRWMVKVDGRKAKPETPEDTGE
jgi:hypothetical protein